MPAIMKNNLIKVKALGGGTMSFSTSEKGERKITIFGTSEKYGRADHQLTEEIIKSDD